MEMSMIQIPHSSIVTIEFIKKEKRKKKKKRGSATLHKKNGMSRPFYLNHKLFESD